MIRGPSKTLVSLLLSAAIAAPAFAQSADPHEVAQWQIYGTTTVYERSSAVPGGNDVELAPRGVAGDPWSSGAVMTLPRAVKAGERMTAVFWARSANAESVPVTIQGPAPTYASFANGRLALTPEWQRHSVSGVAPADLAAGSQALTLQLGQAGSAVSLGPVAFLSGTPDSASTERAFADLRPQQLVQDVSFTSEPGVTLSGSLRLPARAGGAPAPVVILLPGHGPWGRGGYPLLVERLTAAGIATFDYDKRGIGRSTGTFLDTMELMERDAAAAVAFLRTQPEIDGRRIAILGTSQGGVIAPGVASHDPAVAAVVMLAGPAGEKHKLFLDAMRASVARSTRAEAVDPIIAAAARFMDAQAAGAKPEAVQPLEQALRDAFTAGGHPPEAINGFIATLSNPVVISQYLVAPNDALRRIKAPVLALYAGEDDIVTTSLAMPQAQGALRGNGDATISEMPRTNHTFQRGEARADGKLVFAGPTLSDPASLDLVSRWLAQRLTGQGSAPAAGAQP